MTSIQYGSIITGVGLVGLAIYQAATSNYSGAVQSVLAALAAFGVGANNVQHEEMKLKLSRKGMI